MAGQVGTGLDGETGWEGELRCAGLNRQSQGWRSVPCSKMISGETGTTAAVTRTRTNEGGERSLGSPPDLDRDTSSMLVGPRYE